MTYLALYRQYRPGTFKQVLGQETITRTLQNQIISGHFAHAYLFCGSRGTGKTSTAKILARALNCLAPIEGNPCGQCEICRMSDAALSADIIEIDAASNNGVDEIRELRDKIRYGPAITKYKVYIIDEVHMLSMGAFNALLKTLEEPPAHAVFILATTEMHKLPATIVSRCQRFDFLQLDEKTMLGHMQKILSDMHRTADEEALMQIAGAAEGGMRDALSLLDQCLMITDHLTINDVNKAIGFVGGQSVFALIEAMETGDMAAMLKVIDSAAQSGANLEVFVRECMQAVRDKLIHAQGDKQAGLCYAMEVLAQTQGQMRYATRPRVLLDAAAVRLCMPQGESSQAALLARIEVLEAQAAQFHTCPPAKAGDCKTDADQEGKGHPAGKKQHGESAAIPIKENGAPSAWEEDASPSPWDDRGTEQARQPMQREIPAKQGMRPEEKTTKVSPPEKLPSKIEDAKAVFLAQMGKVNAGVSQSIRLCHQVVRIRDTVYIAFGKGDEIFVGALRQHLQDLDRIACQVYGADVKVKVVTEDQVPPSPLDERALAQKAEAIFGVPVEIEEN